MKNSTLNPFYSIPSAIVVGSIIVAISVLMHGGIIKVGKSTAATTTTTTQAAPAQPATAQAPQQPTISLDQVKKAFSGSVLKFGDVNKKLVVVEVADPSCPYCHAAAGRNADLNKQMGPQFTLVADGGTYVAPVPELEKLVKNGQAAFAYIYYPGHGNGEMGAKALYCANEQGKFWDVHDLIMSNKGYDLMNNTVKNDKTKSQLIADFLQPVSDASAMKACLDSGKYDNQLKADMAAATSLAITGTPGFYVNSTLFAGAYNYKEMESAVNTALGK